MDTYPTLSTDNESPRHNPCNTTSRSHDYTSAEKFIANYQLNQTQPLPWPLVPSPTDSITVLPPNTWSTTYISHPPTSSKPASFKKLQSSSSQFHYKHNPIKKTYKNLRMPNKITKRTITKPGPNQSPSTTIVGAGQIRIALCNVNGILKILDPPNNTKTKSGLTPVINALIQAIGGPTKIPDIFCIQETHLQVNTSCPKTFFPGHNQIISYASTDDPYGGMIISYTKALPKPINLLEIFLRSKASDTTIPKTSGRFMILGFQTETSFLIVGSLYGHATANEQQIPLLKFAFYALREISMELVPNQLGIKLETITVFTGDLNTYSYHLSEFCSPKKVHSTPPKPRSGTTHYNDNNKRRCIDNIELSTFFPLINVMKTAFMKPQAP